MHMSIIYSHQFQYNASSCPNDVENEENDDASDDCDCDCDWEGE
eukprot:CAMPEP_0170991010 /NCGR_PEP_ID=MMETSP0736-20130129/8851_1 /TAXON_ID=186038 /ORGANISM="Fragilariopsis kerguelensis, Strain L26-C5" /LENGTH=43 /DNA_ID= /DNA_START= /DNA_END= /DNA_ORIENTATION=